jgi:hypothetical protein
VENWCGFFGQQSWSVLLGLVGQDSLFTKAGFSMSNGFCLASILVGHAFCQLPKFELYAIILSDLWWCFAPVSEFGVR